MALCNKNNEENPHHILILGDDENQYTKLHHRRNLDTYLNKPIHCICSEGKR
jgi:hypothetical protein